MTPRERATAWLAQDPDPETRAELTALMEAADGGDDAARRDLEERFTGRLQFGTAGLRGALGAGPQRMNRVLVAQAAAGFARFLRDRAPGGRPRIVVGYDGRKNSDVFARDSAELFQAAGLEAILLPRRLPTPVLAFAVRHLGAAAGVMVTASHNPPQDNGYKVYLGGADAGSQIVAPVDAEIAARIDEVAAASPVSDLPRDTGYAIADEEVVAAYVQATARVAPAPAGASDLRWVYTAMHGVGSETVHRVASAAGYPAPVVVAEQIEPDGAFPTVAFPNPEEPGALDLALATAERENAELVIANDPDADRVAVAIPGPDGWRALTGNEVGLLLGRRAARAAAGTPGASLACSLVSSPGLAAIAAHYGIDSHETLTGFKWISRAPGIVFAYEEALGYLVNPETVRDKDGISAAVAVLGLASEARAAGRTLADLLDDVAAEIGHLASAQVSLRVADLSVIGRVMASLRADPPAAFGPIEVARAEDLARPADGSPAGDILRYALGGGSRVIFRPSGTEPKLKAYLDARGESPEGARRSLAAIEEAVRALLDERSR
ncbi:phospho-sugar mutase [Microbacterium excoecariae]|uniref:phospho-sugar mutase n=1 Tax=Microbacterium excoecariae TaxID=2715210 RepID=UPI00140E4E0C|nr:phospho-sugar mutase [Microbacterium excoecariae]NHI17495.1 phospho-sugar mutase [Microbacterium excoecariae]